MSLEFKKLNSCDSDVTACKTETGEELSFRLPVEDKFKKKKEKEIPNSSNMVEAMDRDNSKNDVVPEVSVIMAVYNDGKYVAEAIESILSQIFGNFELIAVNAASTDNSLEILKEYQQKDPRVKVISLTENLGPGGVRNEGLKIAKGRHIAIQDADDVSLPDRLEIETRYLSEHAEKFLVHSGAFYMHENGKIFFKNTPLTDKEKFLKRMTTRNAIMHPTVMYRNEGYSYRPKFWFSEDYDLYLRLISEGKEIGVIETPLVKYRVSESSVSFNKAASQELFTIEANKYFFQRLKKGEDSYDSFDNTEILNINPFESKDKIVLESSIKAALILNKKEDVRFLCKRYFSNFGFLNKYFLLFVLNYMPQRLVSFLKSITPKKMRGLLDN